MTGFSSCVSSAQGGLPKHSDPVVLVHDIAERRRLLQAACVSAFGKARVKKYRQESGHSKASAVNLSQESSGSISLIRPQSIMNEDERVQMIPAARSERPQGGGSPGAAQQPPHRQNQGCVLQ